MAHFAAASTAHGSVTRDAATTASCN